MGGQVSGPPTPVSGAPVLVQVIGHVLYLHVEKKVYKNGLKQAYG